MDFLGETKSETMPQAGVQTLQEFRVRLRGYMHKYPSTGKKIWTRPLRRYFAVVAQKIEGVPGPNFAFGWWNSAEEFEQGADANGKISISSILEVYSGEQSGLGDAGVRIDYVDGLQTKALLMMCKDEVGNGGPEEAKRGDGAAVEKLVAPLDDDSGDVREAGLTATKTHLGARDRAVTGGADKAACWVAAFSDFFAAFGELTAECEELAAASKIQAAFRGMKERERLSNVVPVKTPAAVKAELEEIALRPPRWGTDAGLARETDGPLPEITRSLRGYLQKYPSTGRTILSRMQRRYFALLCHAQAPDGCIDPHYELGWWESHETFAQGKDAKGGIPIRAVLEVMLTDDGSLRIQYIQKLKKQDLLIVPKDSNEPQSAMGAKDEVKRWHEGISKFISDFRELPEEKARHNAAARIQAVFRGRGARQQAQGLQTFFQRISDQKREEKAATTIQAVHRGNGGRQEANERMEEKLAEQNLAATKIQAVQRGKAARTVLAAQCSSVPTPTRDKKRVRAKTSRSHVYGMQYNRAHKGLIKVGSIAE